MELASTRRALHGVAELVLAGAQWRTSKSIRLAVTVGGLATVADPEVTITGLDVVHDGERIGIDGHSVADIAAALGLTGGPLDDVYADGSGIAMDEVLAPDPEQARYLLACFAAGDAALRLFARDETPVLWPEHFDVGISVGRVNYGVSPGDVNIREPYAYVGPWTVAPNEFWNESFGASLRLGPAPDVDTIVAFLDAGRAAAGDSSAGG